VRRLARLHPPKVEHDVHQPLVLHRGRVELAAAAPRSGVTHHFARVAATKRGDLGHEPQVFRLQGGSVGQELERGVLGPAAATIRG
jgi:hypothetical protein